jgi:hypothetical protein|tara:strand:- start:3871 stop:5208 length:1338 start_codon:yes stop_codon:yes gene_type:complete
LSKEKESIFNFEDEASKSETYRALFPEKREGIVVIHLYEGIINGRYENNSFSGDDIHRLFEATMTANEKENLYVKSYNKKRILRLQKFFFSYDEETRTYSFQEYGLNFCKIAKETLEGSFKPTKIKKICVELKSQLEASLGSEKALIDWFEIHFEHYHPTLKKHIDFLDRQIDESVIKLRKDTLAQHLKPLKLLRNVSEDLTEVHRKNEELRIAFTETNSISLLLTGIDSNDRKILDLIQSKVDFFDSIQSRLRGTDRRLNRIQPKIKQLFAAFRNPEYSAQTDRFIRFLLKYSTLERIKYDKEIIFPKEVPSFEVKFKRPKYILFDRDKELFPTKSKTRKKYEPDLIAENENQAILEKAFDDYDTIDNWVNLIFAELRKNKEMNLSDIYFRILRESSDFAIATKAFFKVLDLCYAKDEYDVKIDKTKPVKNEGLILWNTIVTEH